MLNLKNNKKDGYVLNLIGIKLFFIFSFFSFLFFYKRKIVLFIVGESAYCGANLESLKNTLSEKFPSIPYYVISFKRSPETITFPSVKGFWLLLTSKYHIYENTPRLDLAGLSLGARSFQVWHGINLKYILILWDKFKGMKNKNFIYKARRWLNTRFPKWDFVVSPSEFYAENTFSKSFNTNKVLIAGYPRNDRLFQTEGGFQRGNIELLNEIKKLKSEGKKVVIYCPTWRDHANESEPSWCFSSDFEERMKENNVVFVYKKHGQDKRNDFYKSENVFNYGTTHDIYPLFYLSDLLITDYSSIFFDYLLLDKPVLFYSFDYEIYTNRDRGLQFNYDEFTPGPKCLNELEVLHETLKILSGKDDYIQERQKIKTVAFGANPMKNSSEFIIDEILKY